MSDSFRLTETAAVKLSMRAGPLYEVRRFPVESVKVHPGVWAAALGAAGGDASRLVVVSDTEVFVLNNASRVIPRPDPRIAELATVISTLTEVDPALAKELAEQVWRAARP